MRKYTPPPAKLAEITASFTYHSPQPDQQPRYVSLRDHARDLAEHILGDVPPGRCQSRAITKLEEAIMWANKGISLEPRDGPEGGAA